MTRVGRVGLAIAVAYVAVLAATVALTSRHVRPLFDATGPPPPYRWVKPPPDFAPGNIKPKPADISFGLQPSDPPIGGSSEDSQFVFSLQRGAIPAKGDAKLVAKIVPVNPAMLGALPAKSYADGNAYQLTLTYDPGGQSAPITSPGSVLLTVPVPADRVLFSADGRSWQPVTSKSASATSIGADMTAAGYYLATSPQPIGGGGGGGGGGGAGRVIVPIAITVVVAAALVGTPLALRRRREQQQQRRPRRRR